MKNKVDNTENINCIGFDLDGTLLDRGKWKRNVVQLINKLNGYDIFFATGRSVIECQRLLLNVRKGISIICDEGHYVFEEKQGYINKRFIILKREDYDCFSENGLEIAVEIEGYIYTESRVIEKLLSICCGVNRTSILRRSPRECNHVFKIFYYEKNSGCIQNFKKMFNITEVTSRFGYLTDLTVNKFQALRQLYKYENKPIENTIYVGDGLNDIEMVKNVKTGIAVYNAVQELKDVSAVVMKSDEEFIQFLIELNESTIIQKHLI